MPKLKIGEKAIKTRNLIFGLRDPRVAAFLRPYGFSSADLEEGWASVMKVADIVLRSEAASTSDSPDVVAKADEFEDHWIPIVKIVLERHYPVIVEELYSNLVRVDGKDATTTTALFLDRLDDMNNGEAPYGEDGPKAREYLRSRGLTDAVVAAARNNVALIQEVAQPSAIEPVGLEEEAAAVKAMWDWYLEWSRLARRVVKDGNLLKMLGFKKPGGRRSAKKTDAVIVEEKALTAANDEDVATEIGEERALPAPDDSDDSAVAAE